MHGGRLDTDYDIITDSRLEPEFRYIDSQISVGGISG